MAESKAKWTPAQALSVLKNHWFFFTFFAILLVLSVAYIAGLRVGPGLSLVRIATVTVANVPDGTEIYVDNARLATAVNGTGSVGVNPGTHTIIVSAVGYQPWSDLTTLASGQTKVETPVLVPVHPTAVQLPSSAAPIATAAFATVRVPTLYSPLITASGCEKVYVSGNRVLAEAVAGASGCTVPDYLCTASSATDTACAPTLIFAPVDPIRAVVLYKDYQDLLLISSGNLSYVLAIDPRDPRFFAPLFKGVAPTALTWSATSTIVRDSGNFFVLPL